MKKLAFVAIAAIAITAMTSCNGGVPKASLKNDIDTVSYAIGYTQSQGIKEYLAERMGIDTTYIDDFLRGVTDGATATDDKKKAAYYAGIQIGQQIGTQMLQGINYELFQGDSTQTVSLKDIIAGFADGTKGEKFIVEQDEREFVRNKVDAVKAVTMEKQYGEYKKQNEAFLAENAKKEGVVSLPSGVQYKVITAGNGPVPTDTTNITLHYEGKTISGDVFDSSYKRDKPVDIRPAQFIPGAREVLTKMPVGSKWEVYIPQSLGYGATGQGRVIKPFSTLIFTFEVVAVK